MIGYQLKIDKDLNPISANRVTPLKLENERLFSDVHDFSYYSTKEKLKQGIKSYQEVLKIKDIDEYVLIILKNDNYIHEFRLNGKKSVYSYIIYCAVQVQNNQKCLDIIYKNDKNYYQELIELYDTNKLEDLEDKALHGDALYNCQPFPFGEYVEISYPAKLRHRLLEKEKWEIEKVIRGKKLEENILLTNETILNELQGSVGTNKQVYNKKFTSSNSSSLKQILREIEVCLTDNEIWLMGLKKALSEIEKTNGYLEGNLDIYNPSNTLYSMYRFYKAKYNIDENGNVNFLKNFPHYLFEVQGQNINKIFFGCLDYFDSDISLDNVIDSIYDGDKSNLLVTLNWGGYQKNDIDITQTAS